MSHHGIMNSSIYHLLHIQQTTKCSIRNDLVASTFLTTDEVDDIFLSCLVEAFVNDLPLIRGTLIHGKISKTKIPMFDKRRAPNKW